MSIKQTQQHDQQTAKRDAKSIAKIEKKNKKIIGDGWLASIWNAKENKSFTKRLGDVAHEKRLQRACVNHA